VMKLMYLPALSDPLYTLCSIIQGKKKKKNLK
jgi:hypothetical protein